MVPFYDLMVFAGAVLFMVLTPGPNMIYLVSRSPFEPKNLPIDSKRKLLTMGFLTSVLNPKMAIFYLAILPQFISAQNGSVFAQSIALGLVQISISFSVNFLIAISAAGIASWFAKNPTWLAVQRYLMGFVLASLAVRLAFEKRAAV
jgi:threonine/homoserine/homoserine lactone efflux protein